jgi:hypothetical protein
VAIRQLNLSRFYATTILALWLMSRPAYIARLQEGGFNPCRQFGLRSASAGLCTPQPSLAQAVRSGGLASVGAPSFGSVTDQVRLPNHGSRSAEPAL